MDYCEVKTAVGWQLQNSYNGDFSVHRYTVSFAVEVSMDNVDWVRVLEGDLTVPESKCAVKDRFALEKPASFRFARFVPLDALDWGGKYSILQYFAPVYPAESCVKTGVEYQSAALTAQHDGIGSLDDCKGLCDADSACGVSVFDDQAESCKLYDNQVYQHNVNYNFNAMAYFKFCGELIGIG